MIRSKYCLEWENYTVGNLFAPHHHVSVHFLSIHTPVLDLLAVARRALWNRVCPSFCPSFCPSILLSGHFLGILSLVFSKFWHGARNPYEVVQGQYFCDSKIGKMDQKWAKNRIFWIYWTIWLLIFTEFILLNLLFAVSLHKSSILKNAYPWDTGQNILSQSNCRIFKQSYFQNKSIK